MNSEQTLKDRLALLLIALGFGVIGSGIANSIQHRDPQIRFQSFMSEDKIERLTQEHDQLRKSLLKAAEQLGDRNQDSRSEELRKGAIKLEILRDRMLQAAQQDKLNINEQIEKRFKLPDSLRPYLVGN